MAQSTLNVPAPTIDATTTAPNGFTFFSTNYQPGQSFGYFPTTGTVSLIFGAGSPAPSSVYIFHQGGQTTPVTPGQGQYSVNAGDYLMIEGIGASCKIQFYYI